MKNKKYFLLPALFFFTTCCIFTSSLAQTTADLLANKWKLEGEEEFGVVSPPDSLHQNDGIEMKADNSYVMIHERTKTTGTWQFNANAKTIVFTDGETKKTMLYYFKSVTTDRLTIEYQTPDLIRTRYRYDVVK